MFRDFCKASPHAWNSLPEYLRQTTPINFFKRSLKTFLIGQMSRLAHLRRSVQWAIYVYFFYFTYLLFTRMMLLFHCFYLLCMIVLCLCCLSAVINNNRSIRHRFRPNPRNGHPHYRGMTAYFTSATLVLPQLLRYYRGLHYRLHGSRHSCDVVITWST